MAQEIFELSVRFFPLYLLTKNAPDHPLASKLVGSMQNAAKNKDPQYTKWTACDAKDGKGLCLY